MSPTDSIVYTKFNYNFVYYYYHFRFATGQAMLFAYFALICTLRVYVFAYLFLASFTGYCCEALSCFFFHRKIIFFSVLLLFFWCCLLHFRAFGWIKFFLKFNQFFLLLNEFMEKLERFPLGWIIKWNWFSDLVLSCF